MTFPTDPTSPEPPGGVPRIDELFSRAVVAQLAELRAQRETFAEVERKLEALERLVGERLSDLSRLLGSGEVELRLELLEKGLRDRITGLETTVRADVEQGVSALVERLDRLEESVAVDDIGPRLERLEQSLAERLADDTGLRLERLEQSLAERLAHLDTSIRADEVGSRLTALEAFVGSRLAQLEASLLGQDVGRRLEALETVLAERLGHLEETVRAEEIGARLKTLELAVDERGGRVEEYLRASDLETRVEALARAVDERLDEVRASLSSTDADRRVQQLAQSVGYRFTWMEGSLRRLADLTATRLEELKSASAAAEAGILQQMAAESEVVGAHFQAVRPAVEAAVAAGPELEQALAEVRKLTEAAQATAAGIVAGAAGGESGPYRTETLDEAAETKEGDHLFLPPEETPIPDRRFGILPRRDRP